MAYWSNVKNNSFPQYSITPILRFNLPRQIKIPPGQPRINGFPIRPPKFFAVIERLLLIAALIFFNQIGHRKFYGVPHFFIGILDVVLQG